MFINNICNTVERCLNFVDNIPHSTTQNYRLWFGSAQLVAGIAVSNTGFFLGSTGLICCNRSLREAGFKTFGFGVQHMLHGTLNVGLGSLELFLQRWTNGLGNVALLVFYAFRGLKPVFSYSGLNSTHPSEVVRPPNLPITARKASASPATTPPPALLSPAPTGSNLPGSAFDSPAAAIPLPPPPYLYQYPYQPCPVSYQMPPGYQPIYPTQQHSEPQPHPESHLYPASYK